MIEFNQIRSNLIKKRLILYDTILTLKSELSFNCRLNLLESDFKMLMIQFENPNSLSLARMRKCKWLWTMFSRRQRLLDRHRYTYLLLAPKNGTQSKQPNFWTTWKLNVIGCKFKPEKWAMKDRTGDKQCRLSVKSEQHLTTTMSVPYFS